MLMFDRIADISEEAARTAKAAAAEFDIKPELWFFLLSFQRRSRHAGLLGLDALWQLTGLFSAARLARPRPALGVGEVKSSTRCCRDQERSTRVDVKTRFQGQLILGIADGCWRPTASAFYEVKDMRVGLFGAPPRATLKLAGLVSWRWWIRQ